MKRQSPASLLLLLGGALLIVGLPLQWSTVATTDGAISATLRGIDYAGYDIATTVVLGALLIAAALGVAIGQRWATVLGVVAAVMAGLWATLVYFAAANPIDGSSPGVTISVGAGVYVTAAGALLALIGAFLGIRGRSVAGVTSGVPSSV
jgi:hypothetical protein